MLVPFSCRTTFHGPSLRGRLIERAASCKPTGPPLLSIDKRVSQLLSYK
ncbi:hypothetical protein M7I_7879 [Glarea lozoyensis 74030]|uniref:Uncharacterized protein n=1 Tax=Glarea lozoyensis (strain ATCC 74030 / MF5533) TaxID=1104152 RepID=H0EYH7_GLAL7|nr:hypothetical protein M7I_7879 [Glarea lozoyensis 74030]